MEPKIYIQKCHNGKIRRYIGKLPPAENGPYEELTVSVQVLGQKLPAKRTWLGWFRGIVKSVQNYVKITLFGRARRVKNLN